MKPCRKLYCYIDHDGNMLFRAEPAMATLYASPYLVANLRGYTKHYYAGTERVCSKLGGGGIPNINTPPFDAGYKQRFSEESYRRLWNDCAGMAAPCSTYLYYSIGDYRQAVVTPETDLYFYHPDHLGSASWITDARGDAIQHMQGTSDKYCGSLQPDSHDGCCTGWWDWNGDGREKIVLPQLNTIE